MAKLEHRVFNCYKETYLGKGSIAIKQATDAFNTEYSKISSVYSKKVDNPNLCVFPTYDPTVNTGNINSVPVSVTTLNGMARAAKAALSVNHPKTLPVVMDVIVVASNMQMSNAISNVKEQWQSAPNTDIPTSTNTILVRLNWDDTDFNESTTYSRDTNITDILTKHGAYSDAWTIFFISRNASESSIGCMYTTVSATNDVNKYVNAVNDIMIASNVRNTASYTSNMLYNIFETEYKISNFANKRNSLHGYINTSIMKIDAVNINMKFDNIGDTSLMCGPRSDVAPTMQFTYMSNVNSTPFNNFLDIKFNNSPSDIEKSYRNFFDNIGMEKLVTIAHSAWLNDSSSHFKDINVLPFKSGISETKIVRSAVGHYPANHSTFTLFDSPHQLMNTSEGDQPSVFECASGRISDVMFGTIGFNSKSTSFYRSYSNRNMIIKNNINGPATISYYANSSMVNPQIRTETFAINGQMIRGDSIGATDRLTDFVMKYGAIGPKLINRFFPALSESDEGTIDVMFCKNNRLLRFEALPLLNNYYDATQPISSIITRFNKKNGGVTSVSQCSSTDTYTRIFSIHTDKNHKIHNSCNPAVVINNISTGEVEFYYFTSGKFGRINNGKIEYGFKSSIGALTREYITSTYEGYSVLDEPKKEEDINGHSSSR